MLFVCPKCKEPLTEVGQALKCRVGHSYDRSGAGYYNLLLSSSRRGHGDNVEMVNARRSFLSLGYYEPLCARIAALAAEYTAPLGTLLDAGSGEGYYTERVERALYDRDGESCVYAFDISKDAARRTAKRQKRLNVAVASSYHMPVQDGSVDTVVNTFSPLAISEVLRVLRTGGRFIFAFVGEEHLWGLKERIYKTPYKNKPEPVEIDGFKLLREDELRYNIHLEGKEEIRSLFMMTPYAYRTSAEDRERVLSLSELDTDAHFHILVYEKI